MTQTDYMDLPKQNATSSCLEIKLSPIQKASAWISHRPNCSHIAAEITPKICQQAVLQTVLCAVGYMNVFPTFREPYSLCLLLIA